MASYNKVILMGNLTRDPQLGTLPDSGTPVCEFGLAVNRRWKDASGADREEVLFIDCTAFGKTAKAIGGHLAKGRPVHVEGRLKLDRWEQEDGQKRSKISVVVEHFRFVDRKPAGGNDHIASANEPAGRGEVRTRPASNRKPRQQRPASTSGRAGADIPF